MISTKAPQQAQETSSKKVLGAYPAHTPNASQGTLARPVDMDLGHFCIVL